MTNETKNVNSELRSLATWPSIVGGAVAITYLVGTCSGRYSEHSSVMDRMTPTALYQVDLDEDGRNDYVVTAKDGSKYSFIAQEDGSYKTFDQIKAEADSVFRANQSEADSVVNAVRDSVYSEKARTDSTIQAKMKSLESKLGEQ